MESLNESSALSSCEEFKLTFTENLEPYQILALTVPLDNTVWTERDEAWKICFYVYIAVMSTIFLMLGLVSIVLLIKKDCIRLPTKTFFAIYMSTAIFGFSRALFLTLDPFGLVGFISNRFSAWFIVSRLVGAFGFPSLVASTTLMIFTLFKVVKAIPGKQWYHYWKFIISIMLVPYIIAFAAELIGNFTPYPGLVIVKVCELLFAFWGLLMCITFLLAGNRLLRQLRLRGRKTVRVSTVRGATPGDMESQMATRQEFVSREQQRHQSRNRRITRKITIITYGTALFTITYSLLSIASAIMISFLLYVLCFGFEGRGPSAIWLAFEFSKRVNEIILTVVLLYSVTDVAGMMRVLCAKCCGTQVDRKPVQSSSTQINSSRTNILCTLEQQHIESTENVNDTPYQEAFSRNENDYVDTIVENHDTNTQTNDTPESPNSETTPQPLPIIILSQSSLNGAEEVIAEETAESESPPEIATPDEIIEIERKKARNSRRSKKTIGIQTCELVDSAVQTEPNQGKPIPKPRRFKSKKSKNQVLNEQRITALRQSPGIFTSIHDRLSRKQTV